jgi:hypothetical protein
VSGFITVREANQTWANEIEIHRGRETHGTQRQRETQRHSRALHKYLDTLAQVAANVSYLQSH